MQNKNILRKYFFDKRSRLTLAEIQKKSRQITDNLFALKELDNKINYAAYLSVNNEVDTTYILKVLFKENKNILMPCFLHKINSYRFVRFSKHARLEEGPFKISQPKNPIIADSQIIQVALLPGVAFSPSGIRLGYGKGVFDKLLSKSKAVKIGLAYDFQIVDEIPKEKHDLIMDFVITESQIIKTS